MASITVTITVFITAVVATIIFAIIQVIICKCHPKLKASSSSKTEATLEEAAAPTTRAPREIHYYEDVDDEGGLTTSSGPARLALSDKSHVGTREDSIVIQTNQAYHPVNIEDVKKKLKKKKLLKEKRKK